jgi:hypothetical protein
MQEKQVQMRRTMQFNVKSRCSVEVYAHSTWNLKCIFCFFLLFLARLQPVSIYTPHFCVIFFFFRPVVHFTFPKEKRRRVERRKERKDGTLSVCCEGGKIAFAVRKFEETPGRKSARFLISVIIVVFKSLWPKRAVESDSHTPRARARGR